MEDVLMKCAYTYIRNFVFWPLNSKYKYKQNENTSVGIEICMEPQDAISCILWLHRCLSLGLSCEWKLMNFIFVSRDKLSSHLKAQWKVESERG